MQQADELDSLGLSFGTDKSSWGHDFLRFYELFFEAFRNEEIKLLEIGVAGGASLRVWEEYFPRATIVGADINPSARKFARDRIQIEIVDQGNEANLHNLAAKHGAFDIIIDDGSHIWKHQISTLRILFPIVSSGGLFIVEDLHTSFGNMRPEFGAADEQSCMDYLKRFADFRVADVIKTEEADPFIRQYGKKIDFLTFYKKLCLIKNGEEHQGHNTLTKDNDFERIPLSFLAHVGGYGDRHCGVASISGRGKDQNIQGFTLFSEELHDKDLLYRARLHDGTWSNWTGLGNYVGTRRESKDLTGFSVRLSDEAAKKFRVGVTGKFQNYNGTVVVGNGEICQSPVCSSQLAAMQISVWRI